MNEDKNDKDLEQNSIDSEKDTYEKMKDMAQEIPDDVKKELDRLREKLKDFKKALIKKFSYVEAIGILPPQASQIIEEEEEIAREKDEKVVHVMVVIPEEKFKELAKVKEEAIKLVKDLKPKVWVHVKTPVDIWEMCFDGKYALVEAVAMSFPLHDEGILGALRVASIHKSLVLRKFEKYVVSYVIAGSLVRGTAEKTSDVDVYVVIDDTDVKRMSRFELKEKLRTIIWSYIVEAEELAGVKNKLNTQVYILTEFWESVKDAHPVIFTFIRDGVPLYDRGAFMPWKLLLRMGKIKPSPEAIDMFMSLGEKMSDNVRMRLNEILAQDIFWGVVTPSQAVLMLYGMAPPTPKEIMEGEFRKVFVEKEKLLEPKYADILEKIVKAYKKYEHDPKIVIPGRDIDEMLKDSTDFTNRLKELMKQIEQKMAEKEISAIYGSVFELLEKVVGKCSEASVCAKLNKEFISKGLLPPKINKLLEEIFDINKKFKKGSVTKQDIASMKKASYDITSALIEYLQRKEIFENEKKKIYLSYKVQDKGKEFFKKAELYVFKDAVFIVPDITQDVIKRIEKGKVLEATREELKKYLEKAPGEKRMDHALFSVIKKMIGEFEIIIV